MRFGAAVASAKKRDYMVLGSPRQFGVAASSKKNMW